VCKACTVDERIILKWIFKNMMGLAARNPLCFVMYTNSRFADLFGLAVYSVHGKSEDYFHPAT
jgi:hypothetical protein